MADSLNKARSLIHPPVKKPSKLGENLTSLAAVVENEHKRLLARKSIIEKRKEDLERQILEKVSIWYCSKWPTLWISAYVIFSLFQEKEEEKKRLSVLKKSAEDERIRLLNDVKLREQERIRRQLVEKEKIEAEELLQKQIKEIAKRGGKKPVLQGVRIISFQSLYFIYYAD